MAKKVCGRCNGEGKLWQYSNVLGGICFDCHGTGVRHKVQRVKEAIPGFYACLDLEGRECREFREQQADAEKLVKAWQDMGCPAHLEPGERHRIVVHRVPA